MIDVKFEERIDRWSASGEPVAIVMAGVALVGRVLGRQGGLMRFRPWGRAATWVALADVDAAGAFGEPSFQDLRLVTARQRRGLGAVSGSEGA